MVQKNKTECKMTLRDEEPHVNKRFPRVRGDVPRFSASMTSTGTFSPRARGCSSSSVVTDSPSTVFPACAGMFLFGGKTLKFGLSFPRVRGDVPQSVEVKTHGT